MASRKPNVRSVKILYRQEALLDVQSAEQFTTWIVGLACNKIMAAAPIVNKLFLIFCSFFLDFLGPGYNSGELRERFAGSQRRRLKNISGKSVRSRINNPMAT